MLDPALIRPGRFDRIVTIDLPNALGREQILRVYTRRLPGFTECSGIDGGPTSLGRGAAVDLAAVAAVTEGLSGAELESIVNEAALRAVRRVQFEQGGPMHVVASDFEASVQNFFSSRKPKGGMNDMLRGVWKK